MRRFDIDVQLVNRICLGNQEAMDFLSQHWAPYCHAIDDIIDEGRDAEFILSTFARAALLYTHPFFLRNAGALRQIALNVTSSYADTVAWEKSDVEWQRAWADHHRHCSNEMAQAVAMLCGGYEHARRIMPEMRACCYGEHHDLEGKPK